jgi:linoleoyl-CoA desaturase
MLRTDFKWYFTRKINNTRINKIDPGQHVLFWASKLLYAFFYIAVPIYFLGWKPWLTGFLIIHFTMGLTLSGWQALYSHIRLMKSLGNKPHTHD